jgi:phenol hydroxylase P1 protein
VSLDIKTSAMKPRRQTFSYLARRYGEDRPASRYDEAVMDVQARVNFHYRPLWAPEYELYDPSRTAIEMEDWYALRDPRQLYYATWNIARAGLNQANDRSFAFVEERDMLDALDDEWRAKVLEYLVPFRHVEWGANMNNWFVADYGYGTAITSAAAFCAADRLGMAQILSRIGLALDGNSGDSLDAAKKTWLEAPYWQGVRKAVEDSFVLDDWFETFVAQNVALDGVLHPLVFDVFDAAGQRHGATATSLMTGFMGEWRKDHERWVNAIVKTAAGESEKNAAKLSEWCDAWTKTAAEAARPLAVHVLGEEGGAEVDTLAARLRERMGKQGLTL